MGDLLAPAVELDVHQRQRIEGDRPPGRLLIDQRDHGARQTFAFAREDAVGEAAGRQRLGGDEAQLRDEFVEVRLRQRQARAFNDPRAQAGMGAQSEVDGGLRKRLQPEAGIARQARDRRAQPRLAVT